MLKITQDLANDLLIESPSFRAFAIGIMFRQDQRAASELQIFKLYRDNKIRAVKFVRDMITLDDIERLWPEYTGCKEDCRLEDGSRRIRLRTAKEFTEFLCELN